MLTAMAPPLPAVDAEPAMLTSVSDSSGPATPEAITLMPAPPLALETLEIERPARVVSGQL